MTDADLLTAILDAALATTPGVPVTDAERTAHVRALAYRAGYHPGQTDPDGHYVTAPHDDGCVVCHTAPEPAAPVRLTPDQARVRSLIRWRTVADSVHPSVALRDLVDLYADGSMSAYAARHRLTLEQLAEVARQTGAA